MARCEKRWMGAAGLFIVRFRRACRVGIARGPTHWGAVTAFTVCVGLGSGPLAAAEEPPLTVFKALLESQCPAGKWSDLPASSNPAASPRPWRPSVLSTGSGLDVLADWLDAPPEPGSVRDSWLASNYLDPDTERPDVRLGCLILDAAKQAPVNCCAKQAPGDGPGKPEQKHQCAGTADTPRIHAEVAIEASVGGTALRLRPIYLKFGDSTQLPKSVHLALYAAVWLNGVEVGVTGFQLPSRLRDEVCVLQPEDLKGHDGLWLPIPIEAGAPDPGALLSVLAVVHQSARGTDVHGHLARIQARARNAGARLMIPYPAMGAPVPGAQGPDRTSPLPTSEISSRPQTGRPK
jgi:hypothetical protein